MFLSPNNNYASAAATPDASRSITYNACYIHSARNGNTPTVCRLACAIPQSAEGERFNLYYYNNAVLKTTLFNYRESVQLSYDEVNIGQRHTNGNFKGYVKNVRIYNRYFTQSEIMQL